MTSEKYATAFENGFRSTLRFLAIRGAPAETAEEVAQAAWVRGWERRSQLRDPGAVQPWVNRIAMNLLRNACRGQQPGQLPDQLPSQQQSNDAAIDVRHLLSSCRKSERRLLERYYLGGWTTVEIADQDKLNYSTVRVRLMRAKNALRDHTRVWPAKKSGQQKRRNNHVTQCKRA
jgi:RNA polymerase sigma factor (sigma-70 family)